MRSSLLYVDMSNHNESDNFYDSSHVQGSSKEIWTFCKLLRQLKLNRSYFQGQHELNVTHLQEMNMNWMPRRTTWSLCRLKGCLTKKTFSVWFFCVSFAVGQGPRLSTCTWCSAVARYVSWPSIGTWSQLQQSTSYGRPRDIHAPAMLCSKCVAFQFLQTLHHMTKVWLPIFPLRVAYVATKVNKWCFLTLYTVPSKHRMISAMLTRDSVPLGVCVCGGGGAKYFPSSPEPGDRP